MQHIKMVTYHSQVLHIYATHIEIINHAMPQYSCFILKQGQQD